MIKENKSKIIYIKNNQEKELNITKLNKKKINKEIFEIDENYTYKIKPDIEYIHFKNTIFTDIENFIFNDTICIFENCQVLLLNEEINEMNLIGNNIEIINFFHLQSFNFDNVKNLYLENTDSFNNNIYKNRYKDRPNINVEVHNPGLNITIKGSNSNDFNIRLDVKEANLIGNFYMTGRINIEAKKITIGNNNDEYFINGEIYSIFDNSIKLIAETLELNNTHLKNKGSIEINCQKLIGNKYSIISNKDLIINYLEYPSKTQITNSNLPQIELLLTLKSLSKKIQKLIKYETKHQLKTTTNSELQDLIINQEHQIKIKEQELSSLYHTLEQLQNKQINYNERKTKEIKQKLNNTKIKKISY